MRIREQEPALRYAYAFGWLAGKVDEAVAGRCSVDEVREDLAQLRAELDSGSNLKEANQQ